MLLSFDTENIIFCQFYNIFIESWKVFAIKNYCDLLMMAVTLELIKSCFFIEKYTTISLSIVQSLLSLTSLSSQSFQEEFLSSFIENGIKYRRHLAYSGEKLKCVEWDDAISTIPIIRLFIVLDAHGRNYYFLLHHQIKFFTLSTFIFFLSSRIIPETI